MFTIDHFLCGDNTERAPALMQELPATQ